MSRSIASAGQAATHSWHSEQTPQSRQRPAAARASVLGQRRLELREVGRRRGEPHRGRERLAAAVAALPRQHVRRGRRRAAARRSRRARRPCRKRSIMCAARAALARPPSVIIDGPVDDVAGGEDATASAVWSVAGSAWSVRAAGPSAGTPRVGACRSRRSPRRRRPRR